MKLMVIDDVGFNRVMIERALEPDGYEFCLVPNGKEALKHLMSDKSIGLVLCDLMMPDMDGVECYRLAKEWMLQNTVDMDNRKIPFILITSSTDTKRLQEAEWLGFSAIIRKPVPISELRAAIRRVITTQGHQRGGGMGDIAAAG